MLTSYDVRPINSLGTREHLSCCVDAPSIWFMIVLLVHLRLAQRLVCVWCTLKNGSYHISNVGKCDPNVSLHDHLMLIDIHMVLIMTRFSGKIGSSV